jgi:Golgi phosphoprotein 3 (GPP34)
MASARISEDGKSRKPHWWVDKLSGKLRGQVLDALVRRGVARCEERKVLGLFSADRYRVSSPARRTRYVPGCARLSSTGRPPIRRPRRAAIMVAVSAASAGAVAASSS